MNNEIFEKLPNELCLSIVDELNLEDILRIRLVCRSWYRKLGHNDFCLHALKKHFYLPIDCYYKNSKLHRPEQDESENKEDWYRRFLINRLRREHGIALKRFQFTAGIRTPYLDIRYASGILATILNGQILFENLFTRQQISYEYSSTADIKRWALFDQYMIIIDEEEITKTYQTFAYRSDPFFWKLRALELISGKIHEIRLPNDIYSLSAFRNHVGIVCFSSDNVTKSFELLKWDIGDSLMRLQEIKHDHNLLENDIKTANLYLYTEDKGRKHRTKVTVHCFKAGRLTQTQHKIINTFSEPSLCRCSLITNDNIINIEVWENQNANLNLSIYNHVTYNMNKRKFEISDIQLNPTTSQNLVLQTLIWRDQIYNLFLNGKEGLRVITISKGLIDSWNVKSSSDLSLTLSPVQSSIMSGETRKHCSNSEIRSSNIDFLQGMWCDDSFLIIQSGMSIRVWQFEDLGLEPSSYGKS
ncbi:hypothetical protein EPUL_001856, partial [Erysiphe pulchra]